MGDCRIFRDVREILREHARLPVNPGSLLDDDNLYDSGMTSHATIHVMLALEERFDIEFPDSRLTRNAFATIGSIVDEVRQLCPGSSAP
jgi:acyl carrier protein